MKRKKTKYTYKFDRIVTNCDWFKPDWNKSNNGLILGINKSYFSSTEFEYQFGFFGLLFRVLITRKHIPRA